MPKFLKRFLFISLSIGFFSLFWLIAPQFAGAFSVSGDAVTYDVTYNSFCVVWEAQVSGTVSTYEAIVYNDQDGSSMSSGYSSTPMPIKSSNGVMALKVTGLAAQQTYYYQIKVVENGTAYYYPSAPPLREVTTQYDEGAAGTVVPSNPSVIFRVYQSDGATPAEGAFVCLEVNGASYPVAGDENSGWVDGYGDAAVSLGSGTLFSQSSKKFLAINGGESITVKCLGGSYGSKAVAIAAFDAEGANNFACQPGFVCADDYANQLLLSVNQAPKVDSIVKASGSDIIVTSDGKYVIKPGQKFTLDVTGSDADAGESISAWALKNTPDSNMTITKDSANSNKAQISWSTVSNIIKEYTVTVEASNDKTGSKTFTVWVTDGKPSAPTSVVIAPASSKTGDDLTCTVVGGVDPLGDQITKHYTWYKNGSVQSSITGSTVSNSLTKKGDTWSCSVTVTDTPLDGESAATASNTVTIANTKPTGNPTVSIGPANPTAQTDLVATVSISGCSDADGDTLGYNVTWFKNGQSTSNTSTTLPASQIKKTDSWTCKAVLTENGVPTGDYESGGSYGVIGIIGTSSALPIGNISPSAPGSISIAKVANGIKCTVGQAATDPDVNDTIKYSYKWTCTVGGVDQTPVIQGPTTDLSNILSSGLAKNQTWRCEVAATDDNGATKTAFVRNPASQDIIIVNNPPTPPTASVSPASPNKGSSLVCSITTQSTDPDGDTVTYMYEWLKDAEATPVYTASASSSTSSTLPASVTLVQGSQYTCKVTPSDGQTSGSSYTTTALTIGNRAPTVVIKKNGLVVDADTVAVNENETLTLEITGSDLDNNTLTCSAPTVPSGSGFSGNVFSWTTTAGSAGMYQASFKVEETDGMPTSLSATRNIQIQVIYPSKTIEDFEYPAVLPKAEDNGWFRLQGQGQMSVLAQVLEDGTTNHYLKTVTSYADPNTAAATGQLQYIATKWLTNPLDTQEFPELQFTIADRNLYYVEVCIHAIDNNGDGKNYFLRYIPQNPTSTTEYTVSGLYINWFIGNQYINPAGTLVKRNMERDLNLAIAASQEGYQVHYDYLMGIVLRGDIDYFDNLAVAKGTMDYKAPKDIENLTATPKDKSVIISWALPASQDTDIIGYQVETVGTRVDKVSVTATTCTITGLTNSKEYTFVVKAFDNAARKDNSGKITGNVSAGVTIKAVPKLDKTPPTWAAGALTATSQNKAVMLTWKAPSDADLDLFEIFKNGASIETVAKTVTSYRLTGLENGRSYTFTVRAYDNASPRNYAEVSATGMPETPVAISVDDFDYSGTGIPTDNGWFRLQGTGNINRIADGSNSYMRLTTSSSNKLNFVVVKWIDSPEEYNNPELNFDLKSDGSCSVEFYVLASNGNRYFMSYRPDVTKDFDYCDTPDKIRQGLYITHYLGWKGRDANSEWRTVVRNLDKDIQDATGLENVTFKYLLGITLRGECTIDNIRLEKAIPDVINLMARPGNGTVDLSWASPDPTAVKDFLLSVDGEQPFAMPRNLITGATNEFTYRQDGLSNDIIHSFRVIQVMNDDLQGNGVEVSAIPRRIIFTDDCSNSSSWSGEPTQLGTISTVYDSDVHSNVISIIPNVDATDVYYVGKTLNSGSGRVITLSVKADSEFWLCFNVRGSNYGKLNLLYITGGTADTGARIGYTPWIYTYLGPSYTDGKWHTLTLNLSDLMRAYYNDDQIAGIESLSIGGNVRVDDLMVY